MARVRKNNAEDFRAVRGISKKPGIQNGITTTIINQRKQLERAEKRSTVLKYGFIGLAEALVALRGKSL